MVLIDYTYSQYGSKYNGGCEYGDRIIKELSKYNNIRKGIFYYNYRPVKKDEISELIKLGWEIFPINNICNVSKLIQSEGVKTVFSPLPYNKDWEKIYIPGDVRLIGTFHGIRQVEMAPIIDSEKEYCLRNTDDYIYKIARSREYSEIEKYKCSFLKFSSYVVITDSETSKYAIYSHFNDINIDNIKVFYPPLKEYSKNNYLKSEESILYDYNIKSKKYGLIVSADRLEKNAIRAIEAYDEIFSHNYREIEDDYRVVITGIDKNSQLVKRIKNSYRFICVEYVEKNELEILYKNAQVFIYPSLNEGFGYPPLEAMKYRTICICSANTSITEICENMVLYYNPFLVGEIKTRILESFNENIRVNLKKNMDCFFPMIEERQKQDLRKIIDLIIKGY